VMARQTTSFPRPMVKVWNHVSLVWDYSSVAEFYEIGG